MVICVGFVVFVLGFSWLGMQFRFLLMIVDFRVSGVLFWSVLIGVLLGVSSSLGMLFLLLFVCTVEVLRDRSSVLVSSFLFWFLFGFRYWLRMYN